MHFDKNSNTPLYQQLFEHFKATIESGQSPAGSKLPSIRSLSYESGCSRNTVETAYQRLVEEGYVISRPGSGYVVQDVSLIWGTPMPNNRPEPAKELDDGVLYDFTYGNLQKGTFPTASWRSIVNNILLSEECENANAYSDPFGEQELRTEIAWRLSSLRNIKCVPEQIVIQGGTQSSIQNLLALFDNTRDVIAMEEPGYDGVRAAFVRSKFKIKPCRITDGTEVFFEDLEESGAKLIYVTPSSQFPTCKVMSPEMRKRLLEWVEANDAYILEDDYCRDFHYKKHPVAPLQSADMNERVIYMGTFSKSLSPSLRMNYLVLPFDLLEKWRIAFTGAYSAVPWLSQAILGRFMKAGLWDRQIRRMQTINRRKYETIIAALHKYMEGKVEVFENGTGLHLLVNVLDGRPQEELISEARRMGVQVYATSRYWMRPEHALKSCILIGFSAIDEQDIEPGIETLSKAWFD